MSADRVTIPNAPAPAAPAGPAAAEVRQVALPGQVRPNMTNGPALDPLQRARVEITPAAQPTPTPSEAPADSARPAWLPTKFQSPEALAQAYSELERRLGGGAPAAPAAPAATAAPGAPAEPAPTTGAIELENRIKQEYAQTGKVSDALRQEFTSKTGFDATYIDAHISHLEARQRMVYETAVSRLGGQTAVEELMHWAGERLTQADRQAFNRAVYSGDEHFANLAIDGLAAKYESEVGRAPKIMAGRKPQQQFGGVTPFQSNAEWTAARRDPRYKNDSAYRQEVELRLNASHKLGIL